MKNFIKKGAGITLALSMLLTPALSQAQGLTEVQINSIIAMISSFGADASVVKNVDDSLRGKTPVVTQTATPINTITPVTYPEDTYVNGTASPVLTDNFCYSWSRNLKLGDRGVDVRRLQIALLKNGFGISSDEISQKSGETEVDAVFGVSTASAVTSFQEKYFSEILTPNRLSRGNGYFGPSTRAKLNALYGCKEEAVSTVLPVETQVPVMHKDTDPEPYMPLACGTLGDVNGDKKVTKEDWDLAGKIVSKSIVPTEAQKIATDTNKDGKLDLFDWTSISIYINGGIKTFAGCNPNPISVDLKVNGQSDISAKTGEKITLSWTSSNADYCKLDGDMLGVSGSVVKEVVSQSGNSVIYGINCYKDGYPSVSGRVVVNISGSTEPSISMIWPKGGESYTRGTDNLNGDKVRLMANISNAKIGSYNLYLATRNDQSWKLGYITEMGSAKNVDARVTNPYVIDVVTQLNPEIKTGTYYFVVEWEEEANGKIVTVFSEPFSIGGTEVSSGRVAYCGRLGDINGDSKIDDVDVVLVGNFYVGNKTPSYDEKIYADLDGDGRVLVNDQIIVAKYVLGSLDSFPGCSQVTLNLNPNSVNGSIYAGSKDANLFSVKVSNTGSRDVSLNGIFIGDSKGTSVNKLSNVLLYEGDRFLTRGTYDTENKWYSFMYPVNIKAKEDKILSLKADIISGVTGSIIMSVSGVPHSYGVGLNVSGDFGKNGKTVSIKEVTQPEIVRTDITGSISASLDSGSPAVQLVKYGSKALKVLSFKITGTGEDFSVDNIVFKLPSADAVYAARDLRFTTSNGREGRGNFVVGSNIATITGLSIPVPANSSVTFDVYVDVSEFESSVGKSGLDIKVTMDKFTAVSSQGLKVVRDSDVGGSSVYLFKVTPPVISSVALSDSTLSSGSARSIARFKISTANSGENIDLKKILFRIEKSKGLTLSDFELRDSSFSLVGSSSMSIDGGITNSELYVTFNPSVQVVGSQTYELTAKVLGIGSVPYEFVNVVIPVQYSNFAPGVIASMARGSVIWSDRSSRDPVHSDSTPDWYGDYGIKTLPLVVGSSSVTSGGNSLNENSGSITALGPLNSFLPPTNTYVTWNSTNVVSVKIELCYDNKTSCTTLVESAPASTGRWFWTVPTSGDFVGKNDIFVKISDADNSSVTDYTDTSFKILTPVVSDLGSSGNMAAILNAIKLLNTELAKLLK